MGRVAKNIGIWVVAGVVAFLLVEVGYRVRLAMQNPALLRAVKSETDASLRPIYAYSRSLWRFNAKEGYEFASRENNFIVTIAGGKIESCKPVPQLNKYDGPGPAEGSYENAKLKVAVFGNSFSLNLDEDNLTWVHYLQRGLADRLHESVHALNLARDGMGLLQMFDVAASKTPEYKPDLAIIAFVTTRTARHWRLETTINGEPRVFSMLSPVATPTTVPPGAFDTALVDSAITAEWCESRKNGGPLDRVANEVIDRYERFRPKSKLYQNIFTLHYSFFWNRIRYKNPFANFFNDMSKLMDTDPQITAGDYAKDEQLAADIRALEQTHIPYIIVHLPMLSEVKAENEYSEPAMEEIANEVSHLTGKPVYGLLGFMPLPLENPERMTVSDQDIHPSKFGKMLYANAVINLIFKTAVLSKTKQN
jgi:hypothetical protein